MDPKLTKDSFAGLNLAGIRSKYAGSAGGAGYDLDWAVDAQGKPASLPSIQFVRLEVISGDIDVDAFAVVPSPSVRTVELRQRFSGDPGVDGWKWRGDPSLFLWNASQQHLETTWDSSKPNSFFYHRLPCSLNKADSFTLALDLHLIEIQAGIDPSKTFAFEIALGFFNESQSSSTNFLRGTGADSPNLVEWNYFPDTGFGATVWPAVVDTDSVLNFSGEDDYTLIAIHPGSVYHIEFSFHSDTQTLEVIMMEDGKPFGPINPVVLAESFKNFNVDAVGICSYSDQQAGGSVFARATIDNMSITVPEPPVTVIQLSSTVSGWAVEFQSQPNWRYQLERSLSLVAWEAVGTETVGTGLNLMLNDPDAGNEQVLLSGKSNSSVNYILPSPCGRMSHCLDKRAITGAWFMKSPDPQRLDAHWGHEPKRACFSAPASWSAAVLCRFRGLQSARGQAHSKTWRNILCSWDGS